MKRSGMPRPTCCALSRDTKLFKDNNVYEDTEPPPGTNILLCTVPQSTVTKQHGCQSFGCGLKSRGFGIGAAIRRVMFNSACPSNGVKVKSYLSRKY